MERVPLGHKHASQGLKLGCHSSLLREPKNYKVAEVEDIKNQSRNGGKAKSSRTSARVKKIAVDFRRF
jgi:hypothetical protein